MIVENPMREYRKECLLHGVRIPDKVVYDDYIQMYGKKSFKGFQAIRLF